MVQKVKEVMAAKPELHRTRLQTLFHNTGYQLLFTPPYTPEVQPIELVWAHVKNYVARQTTKDTNEEQLRIIVRRGFYGDEETNHEGVGASLCLRLVHHCHKWINQFIEDDEDLDGDLMNLVACGEAVTTDVKDLDSEEGSSSESDSDSEEGTDEESEDE